MAKIQNFKFHNSLDNFGTDPPQGVCLIFLGVNLMRALRGDAV